MDVAVDHVVGFYRSDDEMIAAIAPFLAAGVDAGGAAVVIATAEHRRQIEAALVALGFCIDALTFSGHFRSADAEETLATFMHDDTIDAEHFRVCAEALLDGIDDSQGPVHVFGEIVSLLWNAGDVSGAIELEARWNALAADHRFSLSCAYEMAPAAMADFAAMRHVCDQHAGVTRFIRLPEPGAIREVRRFVRSVLSGWGADAIASPAELIVSELATNAVVHAQSPFRVAVSRSGSEVKLAVRDSTAECPLEVIPDPDRNGGRGMVLVAGLSLAWGTDIEPDGKTVWATLAR